MAWGVEAAIINISISSRMKWVCVMAKAPKQPNNRTEIKAENLD